MVRFFLMWVIVSGLVGSFIFIANKVQKKEIRNVGWKLLASGVIGIVLVVAMMSLNHLQGV